MRRPWRSTHVALTALLALPVVWLSVLEIDPYHTIGNQVICTGS